MHPRCPQIVSRRLALRLRHRDSGTRVVRKGDRRRAGRTGGSSRRGGSRSGRRPARVHADRAARHVAERGARPGARRDRQLRRALAEPPDHRQPAAGRPAQTRLGLRPRHRAADARRRRRAPAGAAATASRSSASWGWTARSARSAGVLPMVVAAARAGITRIDRAGGQRAPRRALVPGVRVLGRRHAAPADRLRPGRRARCPTRRTEPDTDEPDGPDLAEVVGPGTGPVRASSSPPPAATTCALFGPPGAGKTMLAQRLPSILPPLDDAAALEVTAVHSIAGALPPAPPTDPPAAVPGPAPHRLARPRWSAAAPGWPGRARSRWPTTACCSWTRRPQFGAAALERAAPAAGGRLGHAVPGRRATTLSRPGSSWCWPPTRARAAPAGGRRCECSPLARAPLPQPAVRSAAGPDRPAGHAEPGRRGRPDRRDTASRSPRRGAHAGHRRPRSVGPAVVRAGLHRQRRCAGPGAAQSAVPAARRGHGRPGHPAGPGIAVGPRLRPGAPGGVDHCGPRRSRRRPTRDDVERGAGAAHGRDRR